MPGRKREVTLDGVRLSWLSGRRLMIHVDDHRAKIDALLRTHPLPDGEKPLTADVPGIGRITTSRAFRAAYEAWYVDLSRRARAHFMEKSCRKR